MLGDSRDDCIERQRASKTLGAAVILAALLPSGTLNVDDSPGPVYDVFDLALKVNSLEARVGIEPPIPTQTRKLFILRSDESCKTDTNAELRYTAGTQTCAWECA